MNQILINFSLEMFLSNLLIFKNMDNCIFCKIIKGEIPAFKIYEDNKIVAFLDINELTKGHTLIVPKKHKRWLWDHEDDEYLYLLKTTKKLVNIIRKHYKIEWVEMVVMGMGVPHTHIHIIPRFENDGHGEIPTEKTRAHIYSKEELESIAKDLRSVIENQIKDL